MKQRNRKQLIRLSARLLMVSLALLGLGCDERTEETDSGGVLLEVEFVSVPNVVSVNEANTTGGGLVTVTTLNVNSVVARPGSTTSPLMDVELEAIEITFRRVDGGSRVPASLVDRLLFTVPVGGTLTVTNQPIMSLDQLQNPPMSDLLFENGGFDKETGKTFIRMDVIVRVFGRTLGERRVESVPRPHTIEFRQ